MREQMPSPAFVFKDLFTAEELRTMLRELALTGRIQSLSGGQKSGSFSVLDPAQLAIELRAELNRLTGAPRVDRVEQRLFPCSE